jgi:CII-binding regulator of phage lambda lysogenization HflD
MKQPTMQDVAKTLSAYGVEIVALRWSLVQLFAALQKSAALSEREISEYLDPAKIEQVQGQSAEMLQRISRTVDDIRAQIAAAAAPRKPLRPPH